MKVRITYKKRTRSGRRKTKLLKNVASMIYLFGTGEILIGSMYPKDWEVRVKDKEIIRVSLMS